MELQKILNKETKEEVEMKSLIGMELDALITRPIGTVHPRYKDIIYEVNYGVVKDFELKDGKELKTYIVGESMPTELNGTYHGKVLAILHRLNDENDRIIIAPIGRTLSDEEIISKTEFAEQYFVSEIIR